MQLTHESALRRLSELHMDDMPVVEIHPTPTQVDTNWFTEYKKLCHQFMKSLTDSAEELVFLNLSQNEFMALIMGHAMPQNLSIRFRVPFMRKRMKHFFCPFLIVRDGRRGWMEPRQN